MSFAEPKDVMDLFATNTWFLIVLIIALVNNSIKKSIYITKGFIATNLLYLLVCYN
jgi:hypothetical protein